MERFVKNFIAASIIYLFISAIFGLFMLIHPSMISLKFVHSHLNMLGWVSMMIYGVGYHILPRFAGKRIKSVLIGEIQFYLANTGLIGMVLFYTLSQYNPEVSLYRIITSISGIIEALSILLFFYNMIATIYGKEEA